jgi:hypothetical protein
MKVFLGWSGETSHKIALALHNWLPRVIQDIKPYISSEDIAKGARWSTEIANELQTTNYGIICVTKENIGSPWINFESGALSREIGKSFVTPFLFQLKPSDIQGPLAQFQAVVNEKDEIKSGLLLAFFSCSQRLVTFAQTNEPTQAEGRITGTVINADGEPISQAIVCKIITSPRSSSTNCSAARTDEHGGFEITHVEMGKVGLFAEKHEAGYWNENGSATKTV